MIGVKVMKKKRFYGLIGSFIVLCMALTPAVRAETMRIVTTMEFNNLATRENNDAYLRFVHGNVVETLFMLNDQGEVIPRLALNMSLNFDQTILTINLRQGVQFHDGTLFTCQDVQRMMLRRSSREVEESQIFLTPLQVLIKRSFCLSSNQFVIELEEPYALAPRDLASYKMGIYREENLGFSSKIIGTGPFFMASVERFAMNLEKFSQYWVRAAKLERIDVVSQAQVNVAWQSLLEGQVDMMVIEQNPDALPNIIEQVRRQENLQHIRFLHGLSSRQWIVANRKQQRRFKNEQYRCVLNAMIDFEEFNNNIFLGKAWRLRGAQGVFSRSYLEIKPSAYRTNPRLAQRNVNILDQTLVSQPITLLVKNTPLANLIANEFKTQMDGIGIEVNLLQVAEEDYRQQYLSGQEYDMVLLSLEDNPLANFIYFRGKQRFNDYFEDFDLLYGAYLHRTQVERSRAATYNAAVEYLSRQCVHTFLLQQPVFFIVNGKHWDFPSLNMPNGFIPLYNMGRQK